MVYTNSRKGKLRAAYVVDLSRESESDLEDPPYSIPWEIASDVTDVISSTSQGLRITRLSYLLKFRLTSHMPGIAHRCTLVM